MSKRKYLFSLKNINIQKINEKYGLYSLQNDTIPDNTTKIDDLNIIKKTPDVVSFLDESKKNRICSVSMIFFKNSKGLDKNTTYKCFWDRHDIPKNIYPIGCPIKYIPSRVSKTYFSELSRENYTITEPVSKNKKEALKESGDTRIKIKGKEHYQTDGIFCSFNCCLSFLDSSENINNTIYRYSKPLLYQMYKEVNNGEELELMQAPHWRMLNPFGGNLTIEKFRESFNKILYVDHGIFQISIGRLYEDQIKL
jgi:hypothetical protein